MTEATAAVQITSFHRGSAGGGVLLGRAVESVSDALVRALIPFRVLPREPVAGEVWRVTGVLEPRTIFDHRQGKEIFADHIIADWAAPLAPSGAALRQWIAKHPDIKGVGYGYAERLWDAYGADLYDLLRQRDVVALAKVLDYPKAVAIVDVFGRLLDEITALEGLDELGLDGRTARAAVTLFGTDAGRRFRENPYLLSLLEPWTRVDAAALSSGLQPTDERRLLAAVDAAAARAWRTTGHNLGGHTVVSRSSLIRNVRQLLGRAAESLAPQAIDLAFGRGDLKRVGDASYQARAPWHIERQIEAAIAERLKRPRRPVDRAIIEAVIAEAEGEDQIRFEPEQREAVHLALSSGVAAIAGGAGTGKSTIVKAIMRAARRVRQDDYVQVALSGRAAKHLSETTGARALTIYRYLKDLEHGRLKLQRGLLVIDECSMVSTPDLWMILTATPLEVDILLVGDPGQLPPIQAGNPAAAVLASHSVPQVTLRVPHRQQGSTGIPQVAHDIREGRVPALRTFDPREADKPGVYILPCSSEDTKDRTLEVFEALVGAPSTMANRDALKRLHKADVQILSATKALSEDLGLAIETRWMTAQPTVHNWGFRVGSKILWTKNSYDHRGGHDDEEVVDIMNGALGVIQKATTTGAVVRFDDATETEICMANLDRVLRGWAITTHKAQGSAFRRVIIPVTASRLFDRAMLYTAITRARHTAVLVGDRALISRVIQAPPSIWYRQQAIDIDGALQRPCIAAE